jgi:hypothetical protein
MKTPIMVLVLMIVFTSLKAAPLRNVSTELVQPDGKAYACFMTGDEYYHRYHDANGYTIVKNPQTDWYVYAQKQGLDLAPTSFVPGVDDPASRGLAPNLMPDASQLRTRFEALRSASGKKIRQITILRNHKQHLYLCALFGSDGIY